MNESFVTAAYQNHARSREPASDKLSSLQRLLDETPSKASAARSSSVTSALRRPTRSRTQVQEHVERWSRQEQQSPIRPISPRSAKYTPSFMEQDALVRKTSRPCSAPVSRERSARNVLVGARTHTAQPPALLEPQAQMFTVDQNLAQSIWKSLGLNRRRLTEQMVERLFREWDTDGSNGISRKEFTHAVMRLRPITSPMEIKAAFDEADLNQDGVIEMNEFVAWFDLNRLT